MTKLIVTIDGPAAVGKGTAAHLLAQKYKLINIDSGAMYRATAWLAMSNHIPIDEYHEQEILVVLKKSPIRFTPNVSNQGPKTFILVAKTDITSKIRTEEISQVVPVIGEMQSIREYIKQLQRQIADESPKGVVVEGRDTGTVVFPDATVKFFLTALADVRAQRRFDELIRQGEPVSYQDVLTQLKERDRRDTERAYSALRIPDDAVMIDSTDLAIGQVIDLMSEAIEGKKKAKG